MIQLRVRTEFSFKETFAPISRCVARLKELGTRFAGIVDSGTWGHVRWDKACRAAGIKPLFGVRIAVLPSLETEDRPTMWFLANSDAGLKELYRFSSIAQKQAARGTARLTYDQVRAMRSGITKFAGAVLDEPFLKSIEAVADIDPGSPIASRRKLNMPLERVLVSDNSYAAAQDKSVFEMIGRSVRPTPQHIITTKEAGALLGMKSREVDFARRGMAAIAERAGTVELPHAPLIRVEGNLEALARSGIDARRLREAWSTTYEERLKRELSLIREKDFESYFLMVADMVRYAKQHMLVGPSRGSAAGSLVCYLAGITEIDPIKTNLIFERFIDVTRKDLPDIDLDFVDTKRHMVLDYLRNKYGNDNVAQIGTVSTFQPKSALITVAKRLGIPPWETNAVKDSIFQRSSGDSRANYALLDTLEQTDPGRKLLAKYPAMRIAADLEAHAQHSGVHAAGVLVCNDAIFNYCTVTGDGVAQLDKKDAEKINLLKIDVLGLRTLGVLEDADVPVPWYDLTHDDPAVFKVINDRRYAGIFQFEGPSLQSVCSQMSVDSIDDIGHVTALARPGPKASGGTAAYLRRRAGKEAIQLPHKAMARYVENTFGVVVYQEQVIQICREIGKLNWEDTTSIRKAMSGRLGVEFFNNFQSVFAKGAAEEGIPEAAAKEIWSQINTMGSWAFNLAHSYSYAVVSYWTAYLKAHHPLEFAAATLRNAKNEESTIAMLRELVREGTSYAPWHPELSEINWSVKDGKLIGGFTALKGIGESKAKALIEERAAHGALRPATLRTIAEKHPPIYDDVFPTEKRFGGYYTHPEQQAKLRPGTKVVTISGIEGEGEFVYIGKLVDKDLRDHNEEIRVKRRNGKRYAGQTLFLDLDLQDDTGKILTRIDRFDYERIGKKIWEEAQPNTWWLVRGDRKLFGKPDGGFKMIFVRKIVQLVDPYGQA